MRFDQIPRAIEIGQWFDSIEKFGQSMACNGSIAWPTTTPRQCIIVMLDLIINFSAGIVGVGNSFMLPCHGGLIVAYYFVAEVAEFVMIAAYPYKTKTPPPSQWQ